MGVFRDAIDGRDIAFSGSVSNPLTIRGPGGLVFAAFSLGDLPHLSAEVNCEDVRIIIRIRVGFVIGQKRNLLSARTKRNRMIVEVSGSKLPWQRLIDGGNPDVRAANIRERRSRLVLNAIDYARVVVRWDNRRDDTLTDVGVLRAGGQTAAMDAPGRKGRLTSVTVQYKILGNAPTATLKVWGLD